MSQHAEWLSLIEISGPFLAVPVLKDIFPQGFEELDGYKRKRLRQAYDEWREAWDLADPQFSKLHKAWIEEVLAHGLELDEDGEGDVLKSEDNLPASVKIALPEYDLILSPDYAVVDEQKNDKPLLLIKVYEAEADLEAALNVGGWASSAAERMVHLCRASGCRLGLITNGERWMLVDAPIGAVTTFASWYARIWGQEPITLQAFVNLLGIRRFFLDESEQLPALLDRSLKYQDEVTEALGEQVRRAVEVLVQALDRADVDRNRELLRDVSPAELYEAGLTVMMRLVFLLCAEERGLLLMGDERYEANYAISTLRMQLRAESEEVLERRMDAWSRLLAVFRAVYGGIDHENLYMPALGGSLFDPDRFFFLEGRAKGTDWKFNEAKPLPIDNRTVLLLLDAIQLFEGRTLSYRALDVEQIGYVYEGLLERTVKRTGDVTLELDATKSAKKTWLTLGELESAKDIGNEHLVNLLRERSGCSESRIRNDLAKTIDELQADRLLTACHGNQKLRDQIKPYYHLLQTDPWGYPLVYPKNAFIVTTGSERRETGTHYTPKSLTEIIVTKTLEPVVYMGPAEGKPRDEWTFRSSQEILELKVCDPAMGSGAFLVQACRYLGERLVEVWHQEGAAGKAITINGEALDKLGAAEPMTTQIEEQLIIARRLIAERCLYGVDLNPLAVELAKLSIWLITLAKGRPFGFLDHNLRCGDSLLGINQLDQLLELSMTPHGKGQQRLFGRNINQTVHEAIELRQRLRGMPIRDIHDVEAMARLDADARRLLSVPERLADAFIGEVFATGANESTLKYRLASLAIHAGQAVDGNIDSIQTIIDGISSTLSVDLPMGKPIRRPFHWPLEFPEVFVRDRSGFDALIGNPPFLGNRLWKGSLGEKLQWQCQMVLGSSPGKIDLCVVFHRRAVDLLRNNGCYGLLATSNIAEGSAIQVGLGVVVQSGDIYFANKAIPWPGNATVDVAIVCFFKGIWTTTRIIDGLECMKIGPRLEPELSEAWSPKKLLESLFSFEGANNSKGLAFLITIDSAWYQRLNDENESLLCPYVTGDDITSWALNKCDRWALDISDRSLEEIAKRWPIAYRFLHEVVYPTRTVEALKSYKGLINRWWQFWNHRSELMARLRKRPFFVAYSKTTKYPICMLARTDWIYTNNVLLIEITREDTFAICLSGFFRGWLTALSGGSYGDRLTLSITESVSTFPLPERIVDPQGIDDAVRFNKLAVEFSASHDCGLTNVMNAVNSPNNSEQKIVELRRLLASIDAEVATAYGWNDLDMSYDFRVFGGGSINDPWRWALSDDIAAEILRRLIFLNKERYTDDLNEAVQIKINNKKAGRGRKSDTHHDDLF